MHTATEVAAQIDHDKQWLFRRNDQEDFVKNLEIDNEIAALKINISLRSGMAYGLSLKLLERIREKYSDSDLAMYQTALSAAGSLDHSTAIRFASDALVRVPSNFEYRTILIRACAIGGRSSDARAALQGAFVNTRSEAQHLAVLAQFVDYCEAHPIAEVKSSLRRLHQAGVYATPTGVMETVLRAVREERPFSLVRLGDGEGAWLSINMYDDGRYDSLYRDNRTSFLNDWFGSKDLIDSDEFFRFSWNLQNSFRTHDAVGIPGMARLEQEEGYLSVRGITASINTYRFLTLYGPPPGRQIYCKNSINLALAVHTDFFKQLFRSGRQFGVVTSQPALIDKLAAAELDVVSNHLIPGDSRNFHRSQDGQPVCQFPEHLQRVDADLARRDWRGTVFLIAAGFVGKRYIQTVRDRGGIALDIGALADHWALGNLPI